MSVKRKFSTSDMKQKKVKIEDPDEIFQDDLVVKKRKGAVLDDVYESDDDVELNSDSDNDLPAERKKQDDDEDMFAEPEPKKPTKKFLKSQEIEGQEWTDPKEEDGEFEKFNMDQELAEGDFTENGEYIRKKDEEGIHDSWLKDVSKSDIQRAQQAYQLKQEQESQLDNKMDNFNVDEAWKAIVLLLQPKESILKAIKRYGASNVKIPKWKKKKASVKAPELSDEQIEKDKQSLEQLTNLSSLLVSFDANVYEKIFEDIVFDLKSKKIIPLDWVPGNPFTDPVMYEYKWSAEESKIHGPFTKAMMEEWNRGGFFGKTTVVRKVSDDEFLPYESIFG
ncbi:hypothetical protein BC833DRAFT_583988 [Globomyces pollinis-pini]|nr:hypothetical protein BC833DRAFT_583988 [Globomyces pollinis-pini]